MSDNHNSSTSTSYYRLSVSQCAISNLISNVNDTCSDIDNSTYMPIVNVVINNVYPTIALLDTASSNTFNTIHASNNSGLSGRPVSYNLSTLGASNRIDTKVVDFILSSEDGKVALDLNNVYLTKDIPCSHSGTSIKHYDHLSDVKLVKLNPGSQVEVLIGQDNADALIPIHVCRGLSGQPFAMQTLFVWTLNGISNVSRTAVSNLISTSISTKTEELCAIQDISIDKTWSFVDQNVIDHCGEVSRVIEGHMGLPIPWKKPSHANNYHVATSRLKSLELSLERTSLRTKYDEAVQIMLDKNYTRIISNQDMGNNQNGQIWYLPHHHVHKKYNSIDIRSMFASVNIHRGWV